MSSLADRRIAELQNSNAELQNRVEWQGMMIDMLLANMIEIADRVDANLPIKLSKDWISVKEAAARTGYSKESMYRFVRLGFVDTTGEVKGGIAIDSRTLKGCLEAHRAVTK
jgi:hypothetical protein